MTDEIRSALIQGASTIAHLLGMLDIALGSQGLKNHDPSWAFEVQSKLEELSGRKE